MREIIRQEFFIIYVSFFQSSLSIMDNLQIRGFRVSRMVNAAHKQFHQEFIEKLRANSALRERLSVQLAEYAQALQQENVYDSLPGKSVLTGKINRACSLCGSVYNAMKAIVTYKRRMADTDEMKDAAARMENFMKTYGITRVKRYIRRLSMFKSLADDILKNYSTEMELLGIGEEVAHLKRLSADMQAFIAVRTAERQGIPRRAMQQARQRVDACYKKIVGSINAYAFLSEDQREFSDIIDFANAQIRRYRNVELNRPATDENKNNQDDKKDNLNNKYNQERKSSPTLSLPSENQNDNVDNINNREKNDHPSLSSPAEDKNNDANDTGNTRRPREKLSAAVSAS